MPFIPHTKTDITQMLSAIGVNSIEELFNEIPLEHRVAQSTVRIPEGISEQELYILMNQLAEKNNIATNFIGSGNYDHFIPAAVWQTASRGEFYSAYTPYQPEVSQGTLQTIFEFQTMMTELTGLEVSNASLYDGASALSEAILMAVRINPEKRTILIPELLHPHYTQTCLTLTYNQNITITKIPCTNSAMIDKVSLEKKLQKNNNCALVIPFPNYFGVFDDVDALVDLADRYHCSVIAVVNPMVLASLKPPGLWGTKGVDFACGDGQPLGIPLCAGGPSYGFLCCRMAAVRQMPGRIVGKTVDSTGKEGFVLALQAREQHIRRTKATSNICTNQGLAVTASTIYMALMGSKGLHATFCKSNFQAKKLFTKLKTIRGVSIPLKNYGYETIVTLPVNAKLFLQAMAKKGILAGTLPNPMVSSALSNIVGKSMLLKTMLVAATEKRTDEEIATYIQYAKQTLC
ncbi:MAG: aminomethyl-transferring glycine dehydrogenase subunit GcvPA [Methylacidiphilales bacterium]|nr:aminomethyl-transferring glycine dehydrogenase subunit GcvPA [Candidatus Methylacidiphilales bacterium]